MVERRLKRPSLRLWNRDYLANRYLWRDIESAIHAVLRQRQGLGSTVLDVGCGHQPYRELFGCETHYFGMDRGPDETSPDLIGDANNIPVKSEAVDVVFSSQVVEHVRHPLTMLKECARVLKRGGVLILTGPFYWPLHEEPLDFYRFTKYGLSQLMTDAGFSDWEIRENGGDWAQIMLSINLKMTSKATVPLRCLINLFGTMLDVAMPSAKSPANYLVVAKR